jgi:hypothetical protein
MEVHTPYELTKIDLSVLQAKILFDEKAEQFYCEINNPQYKFKVKTARAKTREQLRILMAYNMYQYLLDKHIARYCECGEFIIDKRRFVDVCPDCIQAGEKVKRPWNSEIDEYV